MAKLLGPSIRIEICLECNFFQTQFPDEVFFSRRRNEAFVLKVLQFYAIFKLLYFYGGKLHLENFGAGLSAAHYRLSKQHS